MADTMKRILVVEDEDDHFELIRRAFDHLSESFAIERAACVCEARGLIDERQPDLVIADWRLPDGDGIGLIEKDATGAIVRPVVLMTSHGNESWAVNALKQGALDYVVKSPETFADLPRIAQRTLNEWTHVMGRRQAEEQLRESEAKYRFFLESANDAVLVHTVDSHGRSGPLLEVNALACTWFGYSREEFSCMTVQELCTPEHRERFAAFTENLRRDGRAVFETLMVRKDGSRVLVECSARLLNVQGVQYVVSLVRDITQRKEREAFIRNILESVGEGVLVVDRQYRILSANRAFCDMVGVPESEILGKHCYEATNKASRACFETGEPCPVHHTFETGEPGEATYARPDRTGRPCVFELRSYAMQDATGAVGSAIEMFTDVTQRSRLEEQLRQAQRMESLGRLAGGVAHDFNNMLGVILGYTDLTLADLEPESPHRECLQEIGKAAQRSAELTQQLLAFARKQTISPKVLDLNDTVSGMLRMLMRLIGEEIELVWRPKSGLWPVKMDPSQIDQILANLSVNARDAISRGGRIVIETDNVTLDETHAVGQMDFVPGDFVMLSLSDNGCGMDQAVLEKVFEPFFTTKGPGEGTGLGLATVYGIVKQNAGQITVASEPGKGTSFRMFIPRYLGARTSVAPGRIEDAPRGRGETVLLVEDEPALLNVGRVMLQSLGYRVLCARSPAEALRLTESSDNGIRLLVTDVIMPGMTGRELSERVKRAAPEVRCLFVSGYAADVVGPLGVLDEGIHFLQKPFSRAVLAAKVREALDER